jgi:hypothetical protein
MKQETKTLYSGIIIDSFIDTNQRIFQVETYDNETVLCNLKDAQTIIIQDVCKSIRHYWNNKFERIGKKEVKEMPL